jgi:hypothetical protein
MKSLVGVLCLFFVVATVDVVVGDVVERNDVFELDIASFDVFLQSRELVLVSML